MKGLLNQWLARRGDGQLMQLCREAAAIGVILSGGEALAQTRNFVVTGTAAADFRPAAGC